MAVSFIAAESNWTTGSPFGNLTPPAGAQAGDYIIVLAWGSGPNVEEAVAPWPSKPELIRDGSGSGEGVICGWFLSSPSEQYRVVFSGGGQAGYLVALYRGVAPAQPVTDIATAIKSSSNFIDSPAIDAPDRGAIAHFFRYNTSAQPHTLAAALTQRYAGLTQNAVRSVLADEPASGATAPSRRFSTASSANQLRIATLSLTSGNEPPLAPTLLAPGDGETIDRDIPQTFAWQPNDPDGPSDQQSKYDLRYRIEGSSSWTTVTATTPTPSRIFAASTFAVGYYEWQVRTYDSQGEVGPWSASSFFTAATPPPGPTITEPANGATIGSASFVLRWSYPTMQASHVQLLDADDNVVTDFGVLENPSARSASFGAIPNGVTRKARVRIRDGGLWSPWAQVTVHVSYTPPPSPSFTIGADEQTGSLLISVTNPAPSGTEPQVAYNRIEVDDADGRGWGTRHGSAMVARNGVWRYWLARSGVDYRERVRVVAVGDNGTSSTTTGAEG